MKRTTFLPMICLMAFLALFSVTSCDKTQIVEEDLNGFDAQEYPVILQVSDQEIHYYNPNGKGSPDRVENNGGQIIKYIDREPTEQEMISQYLPGLEINKVDNIFEVSQKGNGRSANPKMQFHLSTSYWTEIQIKKGVNQWCSMGYYKGVVSFALNANPLACAGIIAVCNDYMDWRFHNLVTGCTFNRWKWFSNTGSLIDDDSYSGGAGYGTWQYVSCKIDGYDGNPPAESFIALGQCANYQYGGTCY